MAPQGDMQVAQAAFIGTSHGDDHRLRRVETRRHKLPTRATLVCTAVDELRHQFCTRAAGVLLDADRLPRERQKGGSTVTYDLRPLLASVSVLPGPPPTIRTRTRIDPERGAGRPDEVVAALGDRIGIPLEVLTIVRERVLLDEDIDRPSGSLD